MNFIHRLKVTHRFALLGLLALILALVPTVLFVSAAHGSMQAAQREAQGVAPSKAMLKAIQMIQQHRGLSAMVLTGDTAAQPQRLERQGQVEQALQTLDALLAGVQDPTVAAAWSQAQQAWQSLAAQLGAGSLGAAQSFSRHTALVEALFKVSDLLTDAYGLSVDPEPDSYQLIRAAVFAVPSLSEELGKTRGRGSALLTRQAATGLDKQELAVYLARARQESAQLAASFGKAARANPVLQQRLGEPMAAAAAASQQALQLAEEQIMAPETLQYPAKDYFSTFTQAIDAQVRLNGAAMEQLEQLLAERVQRLRVQLYALFGAIALMAVLGTAVGMVAARSIIRQLGAEPGQVVVIANDVAQGNLSKPIAVPGAQDHSILAAMSRMQMALQEIVGTVRDSAQAISSASAQIAQGNAELAERTAAQASTVEQTAASMVQLGATVDQNAGSAQQANRLAQVASRVALEGGNAVSQVVGMMQGINESSRRIADIIQVIDGIAFQTNLLALNAAVEAARAGEQGRGFAVVASEVRNLAKRSADAAREIKGLIGASVSQVEQGSAAVNRARETMEQVVASIQGVTDIMSEISAASAEQSAGVAQVGGAMAEMDRATQSNAALVEEMASAADGLNRQAQDLVRAMSVFRVGGGDEIVRPDPVRGLVALPA
ncbi:MAG TPA: methyl-accepting chemotaxis protein [Macromonas sp.]|nr:methyl-accepting chemotaxis protein [Macromonas sp.]